MNARLAALLRQLADTLDPAREQEIARRHQAALTYEPVERLPLVVSYPLPPDDPWQPFPHHEIFDDPEKMLFNELVSAWDTHLVYRPLKLATIYRRRSAPTSARCWWRRPSARASSRWRTTRRGCGHSRRGRRWQQPWPAGRWI